MIISVPRRWSKYIQNQAVKDIVVYSFQTVNVNVHNVSLKELNLSVIYNMLVRMPVEMLDWCLEPEPSDLQIHIRLLL